MTFDPWVQRAWEYDFDRGVPDPLGAIVNWAMTLRWDQCQRLSVIRRKRQLGLRAEMLAPAGHPWRQEWVRRSMIDRRSFLFVLAAMPAALLESFEPRDVNGFEELSDWLRLPPSVIPDIQDIMVRAGRSIIVGHDGQYLFSSESGHNNGAE